MTQTCAGLPSDLAWRSRPGLPRRNPRRPRRRIGERRLSAPALVAEPILPCLGVIGPLRHFDAPGWRFWWQEERDTLPSDEAARHDAFDMIYKVLRGGEH